MPRASSPGREDVIAARYCAGVDSAGQNTYNVLDVALADPTAAADRDRAAGVRHQLRLRRLRHVVDRGPATGRPGTRCPDRAAVRPGR